MRLLLPLILFATPALAEPVPAPGAAISAPGAAMIAPARLQTAVEMFAGRAVVVDPRLLLPTCRNPAMAWGPAGRSVAVSCDAPAWQVFVPLADGLPTPQVAPPAATAVTRPASRPAIRRGDQVTVESAGPGFVIGMTAIADADSRDGRVTLRSGGGGRRLTGIIGDDGRVRLTGLSAMVNGR